MRIKRTGPPIHRKLPPIGDPGPRRPRLPRGLSPLPVGLGGVMRDLPQRPRRVPRTGDMISVDTFRPRPGQMVPDGGVDLPDFNPMAPPAPAFDPYATDPLMGRGPGPDGGPMPERPIFRPVLPPGGFQRGLPIHPAFTPNLTSMEQPGMVQFPRDLTGFSPRPEIPPGLLEMFKQRMTPFTFGSGRGPRRPKRRFGAY